MRYAVILVAMFVGCGSPKPPPPGTYSPLVAASLGVAVTSDSPAPSPTPAPAGKCENCNGTGKLGDGTVVVDCPVCGGDGRTDNEPAPNVTPAAPNTAEPAPNTNHDPKAAPVLDFYPPLRDARDVLNESKPVRVQEPQSTDGSKPTAGTPDAGGTYYHEPRRLLRGGLFRRGGGTSDGQSVATSC